MKLDRLLKPKSIAIIGGGTWGENIIEQCQRMGFVGDIFVVHPKKTEFCGYRCYPSVEELPKAPDASFVGVNRFLTIEVVRALSAMKAGGAVCFAAGFKEAAKEDTCAGDLQQKLLDAAADMPILGPNCYGYINALDGVCLWPDQHGSRRVDRGVAILSQSSNISINLTMQRRGLPIAYSVTVGNQAQQDMMSIALDLIDDERVSAIGLHIEGIDNIELLEQLARKSADLKKPIVALKVGASEQAQAATISHTASLAGSQAGATALFKRLGIAQVHNLSALLETLKILHVHGPLSEPTVMSMSCSGGEASLIADVGMKYGVHFPKLAELPRQKLSNALGPLVALHNPLDYNTYIWGDRAKMLEMLEAAFSGPAALNILILDFPREDVCDAKIWDLLLDAVYKAKASTNAAVAILSSLEENLDETRCENLMEQGIIPFQGMEQAMQAIAATTSLTHPPLDSVLVGQDCNESHLLTEAQAKSLLKDAGLNIPMSSIANSVYEAADKAEQIGFPVVLKGQGIAHKTEARAVQLNLANRNAVIEAANLMTANSFLVEQMITGAVAELLVGVVRDPVHGFLLTLAAGGTLTELLQDKVNLSMPTDAIAVEAGLKQLNIYKILQGYRGGAAADLEQIVETVMALQNFVIENQNNLQEIDINPLICTDKHIYVADALIRMGEPND